ncbi:uncharacterized protein LOC128199305 [Bicyclus anynana]|uniref:Uncharacterized protein LOC128199305 n=1 Tax=Bicyclus anynana TaxID=110368 RepID=A0ABM3LYX5_BICAN|nr:uncharacterized protein LOC128199305 [Bicyclus anynana]
MRGIGDSEPLVSRGEAELMFAPRRGNLRVVVRASVLDNILGHLPQERIWDSTIRLTANLTPADADWFVPAPVDLLLGADVLGCIVTGGIKHLQAKGLSALPTIFGHSFLGPVLPVKPLERDEPLRVAGTALIDLVQRFWEIEEPPCASRVNPSDQDCELFYQNNTGRRVDGRFVTRLPFVASRPPLGQSRALAEKRLLSMERRMRRDQAFREKYTAFMREYEELGHMSVSTFDWRAHEHYFLPHHAVLKTPDSKIRVVFDGSAPTSNGVSLNQCLHAGPKLLKDISDILTHFRRHQVVFVADIRMMFRQSIVHRDDRNYQLILWREHPDDPMQVYELNTTTYGLRSSPYIAIRTLLELAERERLNYPRAAAVLESSVYMDDICTGASTLEDALVLRDELIAILKAGGFELSKWLSNSPDLLKDLPGEDQQDPYIFENPDDTNLLSVLGIQYRPVQDVFTYRVKLDPSPRNWTKRSVLSTVARTFDPNGWVTPVIFLAKCFLQKLWIAQVGWDEPLQGRLEEEWTSIVSSLPEVNRISISRRFLPPGRCHASLHGFCDASEKGYAAAVYLRTVNANGEVSVHLVLAKSKVAPIRTRLTIPKLELSGATLLARLLNHVRATMASLVELTEVVAWSDSEIVLCWLRASPHNLEVFVANRVSQIQNSETTLLWRHVPGEMNPADCASRGCEGSFLVDHPLWWGPAWLTRSESSWPQNRFSDPEPLPCLRVGVVEDLSPPTYEFLLERYSSFEKLIGVTGWIRRFHHNSRTPQTKIRTPVLSPIERKEALLFWVRLIQAEHFSAEIQKLKAGSGLKGSLARLNPFVDPDGILRVGGRLRNANLPYGARHPLLLPNGGTFVVLLVRHYHLNNAHAGCNAISAILQREFWILSARRVIRSVIFRCIPCYRLKAAPIQPIMGDLPADRVTESRPFYGTASDFGGPFMVRSSNLRNARPVKAYLCVFVCLATKAVHLELVSSLSTEAFVAALSRLCSRRGIPGLIRTDCGSNYRGADRYLKEVVEFLDSNKTFIGTAASRMGVTWKFDPPVCPHWGGIFEAVIKSAKTHLYRVIGETILTFEELATVFCRIEAVLNSRPLCPLSSDPNDLEVLTPGHFLIGQPLRALPEYPFRDAKTSRLTRFELLQQMTQNFWHRWSLEYLHLLQQRVKWTDKTDPPKVGDLVLVKESNLLPLYWRRGRIVKLMFGSDGVPRVAEVMVGDSLLHRAVSSLARLPIE